MSKIITFFIAAAAGIWAVPEDSGVMHCCFKWKGKCACYSTLDGDCRPCQISSGE